MSAETPKTGWLATTREKRRVKRERTGDSPEKRAEASKAQQSTGTVQEATNSAVAGSFLSGGGGC
jgi:hypothetical protein